MQARFFVIKSYTEEDVHKVRFKLPLTLYGLLNPASSQSLKYEIWASTDLGNKRLDRAFRESADKGPLYLFFSVNGRCVLRSDCSATLLTIPSRSGHFAGMAQMLTPVDYAMSSNVWASDKWKGVLKVRWIYIKDVPLASLRHIRLSCVFSFSSAAIGSLMSSFALPAGTRRRTSPSRRLAIPRKFLTSKAAKSSASSAATNRAPRSSKTLPGPLLLRAPSSISLTSCHCRYEARQEAAQTAVPGSAPPAQPQQVPHQPHYAARPPPPQHQPQQQQQQQQQHPPQQQQHQPQQHQPQHQHQQQYQHPQMPFNGPPAGVPPTGMVGNAHGGGRRFFSGGGGGGGMRGGPGAVF